MHRKEKRGLSTLRNRQRRQGGKPGASWVPFLFLLALVAYGMYIGIRYVGIRIRYADLKDKARVVLEYAFAEGKKPPQMKDELIKHAKKKGVELSPDSVYIYQKNHTGYVYFTYTDSLVIPFPKKVVYFYFEVNESLSGE